MQYFQLSYFEERGVSLSWFFCCRLSRRKWLTHFKVSYLYKLLTSTSWQHNDSEHQFAQKRSFSVRYTAVQRRRRTLVPATQFCRKYPKNELDVLSTWILDYKGQMFYIVYLLVSSPAFYHNAFFLKCFSFSVSPLLRQVLGWRSLTVSHYPQCNAKQERWRTVLHTTILQIGFKIPYCAVQRYRDGSAEAMD